MRCEAIPGIRHASLPSSNPGMLVVDSLNQSVNHSSVLGMPIAYVVSSSQPIKHSSAEQ